MTAETQREVDAFDRGYCIAVSNLIQHIGICTETEELMRALGISYYRLRQLGLDDFDRKPLAKVIRMNAERDRNWEATDHAR